MLLAVLLWATEWGGVTLMARFALVESMDGGSTQGGGVQHRSFWKSLWVVLIGPQILQTQCAASRNEKKNKFSSMFVCRMFRTCQRILSTLWVTSSTTFSPNGCKKRTQTFPKSLLKKSLCATDLRYFLWGMHLANKEMLQSIFVATFEYDPSENYSFHFLVLTHSLEQHNKYLLSKSWKCHDTNFETRSMQSSSLLADYSELTHFAVNWPKNLMELMARISC